MSTPGTQGIDCLKYSGFQQYSVFLGTQGMDTPTYPSWYPTLPTLALLAMIQPSIFLHTAANVYYIRKRLIHRFSRKFKVLLDIVPSASISSSGGVIIRQMCMVDLLLD